ncbi:tyrosine-type recombinase/integrase [Domibacillus sp. 8LH]|uniref:tyrosine-type recombinase/integrase n=1 Tax=Domibacillus sp. 8LH TaxID=3073900 RepID=UPI0034E0D932
MRFHELRHTPATSLLQEGINPKMVAERLGPSKVSVTLDTYSHVLPNMQKEAAEKINKTLFE